ncbi:hypothetical protein [Micromonospora sp. NBC_01796]|uniref:hypothetical protein n=1 Tax=Micromonospora sp. NBC_01796 TaxID=2975987 RepID=UPI002DDC104C|nr:hypothetical protein [Micromonospora sp. NBC_01796]WSA87375.1 hypothetical protein OIE47_07125 [Micromonospora sp. NBC_01796]
MAMDDGPETPATVLWASKRVITQHQRGTCKQCRLDGGCETLNWAVANVKANRQAGNRPDRYATQP